MSSLRELLVEFLEYLHDRGALSVPPADLSDAIAEFVRRARKAGRLD